MATISSSPLVSDMELNRLTEKVNKAADAAGEVVRKYYSKAARFQFREKDGDGPVTCADVEAEQAIVSVILDAFPSHSIYGEETEGGEEVVFGELASGFVDAVVDCALDPYDFLALVPVLLLIGKGMSFAGMLRLWSRKVGLRLLQLLEKPFINMLFLHYHNELFSCFIEFMQF
ncbi:hypothetical protein FXO37_07030 [Capsicum annuum]|nr:hypothetical protein FXO37_07030 [Capsicum annuum]